jgi:hypothetical protein
MRIFETKRTFYDISVDNNGLVELVNKWLGWSPDLSPLDFSWHYIKSKIYVGQVQLKEGTIEPKTLQNGNHVEYIYFDYLFLFKKKMQYIFVLELSTQLLSFSSKCR